MSEDKDNINVELNEKKEEEEEEQENEIENEENDSRIPVMVLSIDVGNGKIEQLKLYSFENTKKDIYDFCMYHKLDYDTMDEIMKQVEDLINERLNESNEDSEEEESKIINKNSQLKQSNLISKKLTQSINKSYNNKKDFSNLNSNSLFQYQINDKSYSNRRIKNSNKLLSVLNSNNNKSKKSQNQNSSNKYNSNNKYSSKNKYNSSIKNDSSNKNNSSNKYNNKYKSNKTESSLTNTNFLKNFESEQHPYNHQSIAPSQLIENEIVKSNNNKFYLTKKKSMKDKNKINEKAMKNIAKFFEQNPKKGKFAYSSRKNIYERNLEYKEKERQRIETLRNNLKEDEDELITFKPQINQISEEANLKRKEKGNQYNNPYIINKYKEYQENKVKELFLKKLEKDPNERNNTFRPKINKDYKFIIRKEEDNIYPIDRFDKLYEYDNIYKEKKYQVEKELENKYSFKPKVNDNSQIKGSFSERLQQYEEKSKEHLDRIKYNIEEELILSTKPELYNNQCSINIERNNNSNEDPLNTLYLYNDIYKENKKELEKQVYNNYFSEPYINKSSRDIVDTIKEKSFVKLFNLLDGDGDGIIKNTAINKDKLPKKVQLILLPIFKELRQDNEKLNKREFISVCHQLYNILPFEKRKTLAYFCKEGNKVDYKQKHLKQYPFKPKINKNSKIMACHKNLCNNFSLRETSISSNGNKLNFSIKNKSN